MGRLGVLASLYERVLVAAEVHHEVTVDGSGLPGAEEVRKAAWIEVAPQKAATNPLWERVCRGLGAGERGTILLAKSLPADVVLLDEWKARRIAKEVGLAVTGCLGALETAARKGLLTDLRQAYVDLLRQGIRFDIELLQDSLVRLGLPKLWTADPRRPLVFIRVADLRIPRRFYAFL